MSDIPKQCVISYTLGYISRVYVNQEQVLLSYRTNTSFGNDHYSLPGGSIEKQEHLGKLLSENCMKSLLYA